MQQGDAKALLDSGAPAVLAGDFNVMPTELDVYATKRASRQDCESLAETLAAFVTLALHPASPQAACQGVGRKLNNHGSQRTMTKVGKSDGEGTFPGTRDNGEVAPRAAVPGKPILMRGSALSRRRRRGEQSTKMRRRARS
jgi:hypothetical protein